MFNGLLLGGAAFEYVSSIHHQQHNLTMISHNVAQNCRIGRVVRRRSLD